MNPGDLYLEYELAELSDEIRSMYDLSETIDEQIESARKQIEKLRLQLNRCPNCGDPVEFKLSLYFDDGFHPKVDVGWRYFHEEHDYGMRRYCERLR